jgi:hypothetical protein
VKESSGGRKPASDVGGSEFSLQPSTTQRTKQTNQQAKQNTQKKVVWYTWVFKYYSVGKENYAMMCVTLWIYLNTFNKINILLK